ncbi:MAG: hypothetical protein KAR42_00235 [candidate division Zixibacteria bacterium]|nr:hypothetical protein [candidate division Zixibacteria bacterium]
MSNRIHKAKVKELLIQRDFKGVLDWAISIRNPQRVLLSLTYDANELVKWRAIEAIGKVAAIQSENDYEKVRNIIRQQFWLMNDESGGLGWHAPEIIGEILVNVPSLIEEYGEILLSFLQEEPFEIGSHIAIYRIASVNPKPFIKRVHELTGSLNQPDKHIRAYTILALGEIDPEQIRMVEKEFVSEAEEIRIYDFKTSQLKTTDLGLVVGKVLGRNKIFNDVA